MKHKTSRHSHNYFEYDDRNELIHRNKSSSNHRAGKGKRPIRSVSQNMHDDYYSKLTYDQNVQTTHYECLSHCQPTIVPSFTTQHPPHYPNGWIHPNDDFWSNGQVYPMTTSNYWELFPMKTLLG
ncbi:hypothetical protein SNEBB_008555 [Seison nebaliae]|nr:hypothetical protein SNEBB_008555 [Seison nebaliae]